MATVNYITDASQLQFYGNQVVEPVKIDMAVGDTINTAVTITPRSGMLIQEVIGAPDSDIAADKKSCTVKGFDASYNPDLLIKGRYAL